MTRHAHSAPSWAHALLPWLIGAGLGPAVVAIPVNWAADVLAGAAQRWFRRLRRVDDLSRMLRAATGTSVDLDRSEFDAVRQLLEDKQTWVLLRHGSAEQLAAQIAACLPPRDGRTTKDSSGAALIIARGLLEFAVADTEPRLFQQVVLARLQRMETGQETALDKALLSVHADLAARLEAQGELDTRRFVTLMGHLKRILDQLPRGPADRGEITIYLSTLIGWLSIDPWPRQFGQLAISPVAVECKLQVTVTGKVDERNMGADDLARRCQRLVILGRPGSGKTWLAKRTARQCAENALKALADDVSLDQVELPLYTTCSKLINSSGDIRHAVVFSALEQIGDLGGSRISAALHMFFTERNAPTLLVIDSLDEAHGSDERLLQASTLPWRIVLTSRPSSWNGQLEINEQSQSHRVGELQPLRYPDDVDSFIKRWFASRPDRGENLSARIRHRPALRQTATVPLILAFYCIVGGEAPLPELRRDLYPMVLKRVLTGRWRRSNNGRSDVNACIETLQAWAWFGATNHSISGLGNWADDVPVDPVGLSEEEQDALDHVATPLGLPNVDTGKTLRRFIHRSIREYLVAEHVANLAVDEAVEALLPHIWYDPDWEHSAPIALAMHPQRDEILRGLMSRAARTAEVREDLSTIDARWEFRRFLARVADESSEADWPPETARIISGARLALARSDHTGNLGEAVSWRTSNREVLGTLLDMLIRQTDIGAAIQLAAIVTQLNPTAEDKRQARDALLALLARQANRGRPKALPPGVAPLDPITVDKRRGPVMPSGLQGGQSISWAAAQLVPAVAELATTSEERRQIRATLLELLKRQRNSALAAQLATGVAMLDPTVEERRQACSALVNLMPLQANSWRARALTRAAGQLGPTAEEKHEARDMLLRQLARETDLLEVQQLLTEVDHLASTTAEKIQTRAILLGRLASETNSLTAGRMAITIAKLAPTVADKRQALDVLLRLLTRQSYIGKAEPLLAAMADLTPTAQDKLQTLDELLKMLAEETDRRVAELLLAGVAPLATNVQGNRQVFDAILTLLSRETDSRIAEQLALVAAQLTSTAEDKHEVLSALLRLLSRETNSHTAALLAGSVTQLNPTAQEKRLALDALLRLLTLEKDSWPAEQLARRVTQLDPTAKDRRQALDALFRTRPGRRYGGGLDLTSLLAGVAHLAGTAESKRQAREVLLELLTRKSAPTREVLLELLARKSAPTGESYREVAQELLAQVASLATTAEDMDQALDTTLKLLARETNDRVAVKLALGAAAVATTPAGKQEACRALLRLLARKTDIWTIRSLVGKLQQLDSTAEDKSQARELLLRSLRRETDSINARILMGLITELDPTVYDLSTCSEWAAPPTSELLAAVRRNSTIIRWLDSLPMLASFSH